MKALSIDLKRSLGGARLDNCCCTATKRERFSGSRSEILPATTAVPSRFRLILESRLARRCSTANAAHHHVQNVGHQSTCTGKTRLYFVPSGNHRRKAFYFHYEHYYDVLRAHRPLPAHTQAPRKETTNTHEAPPSTPIYLHMTFPQMELMPWYSSSGGALRQPPSRTALYAIRKLS